MDSGRLPDVPGPRWHAVASDWHDERLAAAGINRLGFATFLPLLRIAIRDKRVGRRVTVVPAFPGYLFAQWDAGDVWQRIRGARGVTGIIHSVGDRELPLPVSCEQIDALLARAREGGIIEDASVAPVQQPIPRDALVRLTDGPFAGHMGLCQMSNAERVTVLLNIMGADRNVTAQRRYVEPV